MKSHKTSNADSTAHSLTRRDFLKMSITAITLVSVPIRLLRPEETANAALAVDKNTPIGKKWVRLGGEPVVGGPISEVVTTPDGLAQYQIFANGVIIYSNDWGAMYVSQAIFDKWLSLNQQVNPAGQNLLGYVGFPKQDYENLGGFERAHFERGMIVVDITTAQALVIYGFIYEHYWQSGGAIGLPVAEETDALGGGRFQAFQGGDIYWRTDVGAFTVYGGIRQRWLDLGGAGGILGYPLSDEEPVKNDGVEVGRSNKFENGVIYFSMATGAWEVRGGILDEYVRNNGPVGWLGFPTSGQGVTESWQDEYNNFQHGILVNVVNPRDLPSELVVRVGSDDIEGVPMSIREGMYPIGKLDLYVQRLQGNQRDSILGWGGSTDIYVKIIISTSDGVFIQERRPTGGEYEGEGVLEEHFLRPDTQEVTVHSGLVFELIMDAWDDDNDFIFDNPDDHLGILHKIYNIDNLWGLFDGGKHRVYDGDDDRFDATYSMQNPLPYDPSQFRQQMWWRFRNFDTHTLSYDQFAATFSDVDTDELWWVHPFNALYYELGYKRIARRGNCFGMSLESVFAQVGRSLYAEPINRFWPDLQPIGPESQQGYLLDLNNSAHASTMYELNIKHGYQLGAPSVNWFLDKFLAGEDRNPVQCFLDSRAAHDRGDYPLIAFNRGLFKGHTVRPYRWDDSDPTNWKIYIADPNKPVGLYPDDNDPVNRIEIDPRNNSYIFPHYADDIWSGDDSGGVRMFYIPFRKLSNQPRTPFWDIFLSLLDGTWLLLDPTGITKQITGEAHRTLYEEGLENPPTEWENIRLDPALRIPNMTRVPFSDIQAEGETPLEIHYARGSGATYQQEILARPGSVPGTPYEWVLQSAALSARVLIPSSADVADMITAHLVNSPDKAVSVNLPRNSVRKNITWVMAGPVKHRWLELTNLELVPGQSITIKLTNGGFEAVIDNSGPKTSADLRVQAGPGANPVIVGRITIQKGTNSPLQFDFPLISSSVSRVKSGENGWLFSYPTITLSAQENSDTVIDYDIEYSVNGIDWSHYTKPFLLAYEGVTDFYYRAIDNAGNQDVAQVQRFMIDTRPPELTAGTNQEKYTRLESIIVSFEANDSEPGSGLAQVISEIGNTPVTNGQVLDFFWHALGTYKLSVTAQDHAGWHVTKRVDFKLVATLRSMRETIIHLRGIGEIENDEIMSSLVSKIDDAILAENQNKFKVAIRQLRVFLKDVTTQKGKHMTRRAAELLINDCRYVEEQLRRSNNKPDDD